MADNLGILSILECPVCMEYMVPPIYQCHNQHLLCSDCHKKQTICPVCRLKLEGDRNTCMEKVTEYISYPCRNEGSGCNAMLRLFEKQNHEKICVAHGQHHCLLPMIEENGLPCVWIGRVEEADGHIRQKHNHLIHKSNDGSFRLYASEMMDSQHHILFDDNLFCCLIHKEPLRTSSIQKVYTVFFHVVNITFQQTNNYAYSVKVQGQGDTFEGFVGNMGGNRDLKDMAHRNECHHFMGEDNNCSFKVNIVKI